MLAKRDEAFWIEQYQAKKALWMTDEDPRRPHALLTSELHSGGFFNSRIIIPDDALLRMAASDLVDKLENDEVYRIDRVVGPQTGATKLAEYIADAITKRRGRPCLWASPMKHGMGTERHMVFDDPNRMVQPGEVVQLCEDVISTGGSVERTAYLCHQANGYSTNSILALVNRSGLQGVAGKEILALINRPMPTWTSDNCPLCSKGSVAIQAKDPLNWKRLNEVY